MKRFNPEHKKRAKQIIDNLIQKHNITADFKPHGNAGGAYYYEEGNKPKVRIPTPRNSETFGICLHEIGHIVLGHCAMKNGKHIDKRPSYIHEYETMQFAINKLKEYGFYTKRYELREIRYMLENIAQAYNRRHPLSKVPKEIIKWTRLKVNKWKGSKKVFVPRKKIKSFKDIEIQYYD